MYFSWRVATIGFGAVCGILFFAVSGATVLAAGDGCAQGANPNEVNQLQTDTGIQSSEWSCQKTAAGTDVSFVCVSSPSCGAGAKCCLPGTGSPTGATQAPASQGQAQGSIWIPADIQACMQRGNCGLDQIVKTGAAFANFLFGLSGALALLILVYGGFLYLISAGDSGKVAKAVQMIKEAAIGLVFIFTANALIRFVYTSFVPSGGDSPSRIVSACETFNTTQQDAYQKAVKEGKATGDAPQSYLCKVMPGITTQERDANATAANCNLSVSCNAAGIYCCPLEPPAVTP